MIIKRMSGQGIRRAGWAALSSGVLASALLVAAPAASADSWQSGCIGYNPVECVDATMGGKNSSNHTQWVGWVDSRCSGGGGGTCYGVTKLETWGDGFYFSTAVNPKTGNPSATWGAQRWVHSGTNVCAAQTDTSGYRAIECIHISV